MLQVPVRLARKTLGRLLRLVRRPAAVPAIPMDDAPPVELPDDLNAPPLASVHVVPPDDLNAPPLASVHVVPPDDLNGPLASELAELGRRIPYFTQEFQTEQSFFNFWGLRPDACMPPECFQDKDVLDVGCGVGASSALFLARGARFVWGIDPTLAGERLAALRTLPRSRFTPDVLRPEAFGDQRFDLVYSHFVTEHIADLDYTFRAVRELLRPGGRFISLHTNYYGPLGGHDHAFAWPAADNPQMMCPTAVRCWESPAKCDASAEFRAACETRHDWTVRTWDLTPEDCTRCLYYQRAQLWGHLLYQDEFPRNYPGDFFRLGVDGGLNKVTPFQLRQHLVESGFRVTTWVPDCVANDPPPELLDRFPRLDLVTANILFAADRID